MISETDGYIAPLVKDMHAKYLSYLNELLDEPMTELEYTATDLFKEKDKAFKTLYVDGELPYQESFLRPFQKLIEAAFQIGHGNAPVKGATNTIFKGLCEGVFSEDEVSPRVLNFDTIDLTKDEELKKAFASCNCAGVPTAGSLQFVYTDPDGYPRTINYNNITAEQYTLIDIKVEYRVGQSGYAPAPQEIIDIVTANMLKYCTIGRNIEHERIISERDLEKNNLANIAVSSSIADAGVWQTTDRVALPSQRFYLNNVIYLEVV